MQTRDFRKRQLWLYASIAAIAGSIFPQSTTQKQNDFAIVLDNGGHRAQIEGVAFSSNGLWLASADNGGRIVLWDIHSRRAIRAFLGKNFTEVAFTPDSKLLAAAGFDGTIRIWRTDNGKSVFGFDYPGQAEALAISPAGDLVAAGGGDHNIHLWSLKTWRVVMILRGHSDDVYSVKFSPDGKRIASGGRDRTIRFTFSASS